jgi:hydroxyacylglutathione hydrolase
MLDQGLISTKRSNMANLSVHQFPCLEDNFGVLVHDHPTGTTIAIDAPEAKAVIDNLKKRGWQLTHILTTHHHADHVDGNLELREAFGCQIIGPAAEKDKIPGIKKTVKGGDLFKLAGSRIRVYDCPGHTLGHVSYHFEEDFLLFAGDTIFSLGCGRVNEGTMEQMHASVNQFNKLQPMTSVYCGHEYTLGNAKFALSVEAGNKALQMRAREVESLRASGKSTLPTTIGDELKANPFMRCNSLEIRQTLGMVSATDAEVFAELRTRKNNFR